MTFFHSTPGKSQVPHRAGWGWGVHGRAMVRLFSFRGVLICLFFEYGRTLCEES